LNRQLGQFLERQIAQLGRIHVIELTNGDRNRQNLLFGKARRSFIIFIMGGLVAILWNVVSTFVAVALFENKSQPNKAPEPTPTSVASPAAQKP
jgi:hypothetical protein